MLLLCKQLGALYDREQEEERQSTDYLCRVHVCEDPIQAFLQGGPSQEWQ